MRLKFQATLMCEGIKMPYLEKQTFIRRYGHANQNWTTQQARTAPPRFISVAPRTPPVRSTEPSPFQRTYRLFGPHYGKSWLSPQNKRREEDIVRKYSRLWARESDPMGWKPLTDIIVRGRPCFRAPKKSGQKLKKSESLLVQLNLGNGNWR